MVEIIVDKEPSSTSNTNAKTTNIDGKGVAISEPNQQLVTELITQVNIQKIPKC